MSHLDGVLWGVVVDEDGRGVVRSCLQDLLLKGAVTSLHQRHPVDTAGRDQEVSVWVASLAVDH